MSIRPLFAAIVACAAVAATAALATAAPAVPAVTSSTTTCAVSSMPGLKGFTKVRITGRDLTAATLGMTGCSTAYDIVQQASTTQVPFSLDGYDCTPQLVSKRVGRWTCANAPADDGATLRLRFTARLAK